MVKLATLDVLEDLEREMAQAGRSAEEEALHDALRALTRPGRGLLSTGQAAELLGVSSPTVRRWIERGVLAGGQMGARWLVSWESVDRILRLRESLDALDREGNPTEEEIREMYSRPRRISKSQGVAVP